MQEHKEKNTNAYLVCIDKYLDYWITKGIAFLEVEKKRKINNSLIENKLLIHLPEKYKLITEKTNQIPVLIDDVEQIISPTEEQTRFLRTKYNTLGESWIPFKSEPNSQINEVFLAKIQKTMMSTNTKKQSKTKSNSGKKSSEEIQGELPLGQSCQYHNPELSASNNGSSLIDLFNDYGGIQYSVVSSFDYIRESPERDFALLLWLIFSEAIARAGNIKNCWIWIEYQLSYLKQATSALEKKLRKYIETLSLWSPLLVLLSASQSQSDEEFINQLNSSNALYCENEALRAILRIIIHLFRKQGKYLFSPGNWGDNEVKPSRENITDPQQCSIVKLGIILKNLIESEGENSTQKIYESWLELLRKLNSDYPNIDLSSYKKDDQNNHFLKLLSSILEVGNWLPQRPEYVHEMIKEKASKLSLSQDTFDINQLLLASFLFGWIKGYTNVGNWISNNIQRRYLSSLAIRMAINNSNEKIRAFGIDPIIFYSSREGDRLSYEASFIRVKEEKTSYKFSIASDTFSLKF